MTDKAHKSYPDIGQSIGITFIVIAGMIFFGPIILLKDLIGNEPSTFIYYLLATGTTFWIIYEIRKSQTGEKSFNFKLGNTKIIPFVIIGTIALQYAVTLPVVSLLPMSDTIREIFSEAIGDPRNVFAIATLVILAPVLEELIFRGIVLNGLLKKYSPTKAIVISSILFGFVHLNPWQFVSALCAGFFIGWVYYHTRSLTFAIIIHSLNNFVAVTPSLLGFEYDSITSLCEMLGGVVYIVMFFGGAAILFVGSIYYLLKEFSKIKEFESDAAQN